MSKSNLSTYLIIALLVVAAGLIGAGFVKIQWLESQKGQITTTTAGTPAAPQPQKADPLSESSLKGFAKDLKLDLNKFNACLADAKTAQRITDDQDYAKKLGVRGTPNFFINGRLLGGAFPLENFKEIIDKELSGNASADVKSYSQILQDAANTTPPAFNPVAQKIEIRPNTPILGSENAAITIVEISDFSCPYCVRATTTTDQLLKDYAGKIRFAYSYYPGHGTGELAQKAAYCAQEQNKYWEMHNRIFAEQRVALGL